MAEKQGFEPWEGITPQRFSRPPLSAAQPPLQSHIIWRIIFIAIKICIYFSSRNYSAQFKLAKKSVPESNTSP